MNVAAAYSLDVIDDDTLFDCEGFETIAGQMIRCGAYPGTHGVQTPADVLKNSCNAGMMQIGQKMGAAEFLRYQDIFGFGSLTGIDLPGEAYGLVHTEDTMGPTELATSTFGQGYTVTMVQQAAAFSSLINGGNYYQPHVMKTITDSTGAVVESNEPNLVRQTVSAEISDKMRSFLQGVVTDGSGQSAKVAGYTMGGKQVLHRSIREAMENISFLYRICTGRKPESCCLRDCGRAGCRKSGEQCAGTGDRKRDLHRTAAVFERIPG